MEATTGIEPVYAVLQIELGVLTYTDLSTNPTIFVRHYPCFSGN